MGCGGSKDESPDSQQKRAFACNRCAKPAAGTDWITYASKGTTGEIYGDSSASGTSSLTSHLRSTVKIQNTASIQEYIYSRKEFQGSLIGSENVADDSSAERLVLITDMGQDNDDEMALLLLSELARRNEAKVQAVVANLRPANRRAALARGTLDILDMSDVPVGIGTDGGSLKHSDTFSEFISEGMTGIDYFSFAWEHVQRVEEIIGSEGEGMVSETLNIFDGQKLLVMTLEGAEDLSLNLVLISSLKDAAMLLRSHEELFLAKVKCVTIMGGMQLPPDEDPESSESSPQNGEATSQGDADDKTVCTDGSISRRPVAPNGSFQKPRKPREYPLLVPSDAHNNVFDAESAQFFYRRCQEIGVPLVVISRFTAYGCPVQKFVYDLMVRCPIPHPTVCRLQRAQRKSIESLWQNVCAGDKLPPRCNKQWFCDTFCGGDGEGRDAQNSMWDLVKTFNMYDPLAIIACLPRRRRFFFQPEQHIGPDGTVHLNIGVDKDHCGIRSDRLNDLHDFMMTTWIRAAGRIRRHRNSRLRDFPPERPPQLDQEQLTAALTPMMTHSPEDLQLLNKNVLRLLDVEWPQLKNSSLLSTWKDRDRLMTSIGPSMILVDPETVNTLGRIPHSAEGKGITMEEAAKRAGADNMRFFIEMFSHRWHSSYAPDDRYCNKARVLCEWAKYRRSMNFRTFFWIDHSCIDQSDIAPGVAMLPLYVSCCNNILCYDVPEYEPRAWCRVERLLFVAFVAPNNEFVAPDFEHHADSEKLANGELKPLFDGTAKVPDPAALDAELSFQADAQLIVQLKDLCTAHWAQCWKDGLKEIVEKNGLRHVRNLRYGGTEIRMRRFG